MRFTGLTFAVFVSYYLLPVSFIIIFKIDTCKYILCAKNMSRNNRLFTIYVKIKFGALIILWNPFHHKKRKEKSITPNGT